MNVRNLIFISVAISALVVALLLIPDNTTYLSNFEPPTLDFDYSINADIAAALSGKDISMSSAIKISKPSGIEKYCTFFDDPERQSHIQYCTSTELRDKNGDFLGNIHMVGTVERPKLVIVIMEVPLDEIQNVVAVFDAVIDTTVCQCWKQESPGGFPDVTSWVDALNQFHRNANAGKVAKSGVITLDDKKIQMELVGNKDGQLWKLFVAK